MVNKLIHCWILYIFCFVSYLCNAQQASSIDSLYKLVALKKDTALVHLYITIGQQYEGTELDSSKVYYKKAEALSEKIKYPIGILKFISNYTYVLNLEGKYEEGLTLNKKGLQIAHKINNTFQLAAVYSNIAASYQYMEKYDLAIENYLKALEYIKILKDEKRFVTVYSNLCGLYESIEQNEKSLRYAIEAENIARKYHMEADLENALTNKTCALCNLGRYTEADSIIDEVLELAKKHNNDYIRMVNLTNKCQVLMYLNRNTELKPYATEANVLSKKMNSLEGEINSLIGLSDYYMNTNAYQKSYEYAQQALQLSQKMGSLEYIKKSAMTVANACMTIHDMKGFHIYAMLHDSIDRAIYLEKTNKTIIEITTKYETDKKNLQIQALESKSKKRLWISIALALGIISIAIIAFMQYQSFATKKKLVAVEQEKAVAEERLRIASDMHDDVGTGLSRIRYITNSIKLGETTQDIGLNKVAAISDETITKMSEIIWALNETNQTLEELIYFIRSQASEMVENAQLHFEGNLPENIPAVSFGWMRNRHTYLLVKETIHNAIKHANAKKITLKFDVVNELSITIQDDGIGFDTTKKYTGNGLHNYQKRIQKINGTMVLDSKIGSGTKVIYKIPFV